MTRKDMIRFLVRYCDDSDNCHLCPGKVYCIGLAEESDEIGESAFSLMTDAEVRDMYLKMLRKFRIDGGRQ